MPSNRTKSKTPPSRRILIKQCVDDRGWQHLRLVDPKGNPLPGQKHVEISADTTNEVASTRRGKVKVTFELGPDGVELWVD